MSIYELEDRIYFDGALPIDIAETEDTSVQETEATDSTENMNNNDNDSSENVSISPEINDIHDSDESNDELDNNFTQQAESNIQDISQNVDPGLDSQFDNDIDSAFISIDDIILPDDFQSEHNIMIVSSGYDRIDSLISSVNENTSIFTYDSNDSVDSVIQKLRDELENTAAHNITIVDSTDSLFEMGRKATNSFLNELSDMQYFDGELNIINTPGISSSGSIFPEFTISSLSADSSGVWSAESSDTDSFTDYFNSDSDIFSDCFNAYSSLVSTETEQLSTNHEIVFINSSVMDADEIVDDLHENAEIVYLESGDDGIQQITDYLANKTDIDTIRIISHGNEGYFVLCGQIINSDYVTENADTFYQWRSALSENADIMLYGCNLASNIEGQELVQYISSFTNADVAAATHITGGEAVSPIMVDSVINFEVDNSLLDIEYSVQPSWTLDFNTGTIESLQLDIHGYDYHLTNQTVTSNADDGAGTLRQAISDVGTGEEITFDGNFSGDNRIVLSTQLSISDSITITGNGIANTVIDGDNNCRIFNITGGTVELSNMTIQNGNTGSSIGDSGGGIYVNGITTLTLSSVDLTNNTTLAEYGGGIYVGENSTVIIDNSTIENNQTGHYGGGIFTAGSLTVTNSTICNNAGNSSGVGGGISAYTGSNIILTNSTIFGNTATAGGGGIEINGATTATITDCTISDNTAPFGAGILVNGTVTVTNSIVAYNSTGLVYDDISDYPDYYIGTFYGNYNIYGNISVTTTGGNNNTTFDYDNPEALFVMSEGTPVLADNGGPTYTVALVDGSIAIETGCYTGTYNSGTNYAFSTDSSTWYKVEDGTAVGGETITQITTDQRGVTIAGTPCIGSYTQGSSATYYMAKNTGLWSNTAIWFTNTNGGIDPASYTTVAEEAPDADNSSGIIIYDGYSVTVDSSISVDQMTINSTAGITVNDNVTLTVADDGIDNIDLDADGTITVNNTSSTGTLLIASGAAVDSDGEFTINGVLSFDDSGDNDGALTLADSSITIASLTAGGSTITYDGGNQAVAALNYNTLSFAGSTTGSIKTFADGTAKVAHEISLTDAITLTGSSKNNVTVQVTTPGEGGTASRVFDISASEKTITLENMTIKGGDISSSGDTADGYGGAIYIAAGTVNLNCVTVSSSKAYSGGGIYNTDTVHSISNSTISSNYATGDGGGIYNVGTIDSISGSLISGNYSDGSGGGIMNNNSGMIISNSTIYGNTAVSNGGGIAGSGASPIVTITDTTISSNEATTGDGGGVYFTSSTDGGILTLSNSIIASNTNGDLNIAGSSTLDDNGYNVVKYINNEALLTDGSDIYYKDLGGGSYFWYSENQGDPWLPNQNLNLAADLTYSGGFTQTLAVTAGSFLNETYGYGGTASQTDQRGYYRTDEVVTRGAYQYNGIVAKIGEATSWTGGINTYTAINDAIDNAYGGDTVVLAGTSILMSDTEMENNGIVVDKGVTITGEEDDSTSTIVRVTDPGSTNSRVFNIDAVGETVTIENMTIKGGDISGLAGADGYGGAISVTFGDASINNVTVSESKAYNGGGIFINSGTEATIESSTISSNTATNNGGGIYTSGTLTVNSSTLSSNSAETGGGGIFINSGTANIASSSILTENSASSGGGIVVNSTATLTVDSSTLSNNTASTDSTGGGGILNLNTLTITSSTFTNNSASNGTGGGIFNYSGTATLNVESSTFSSNSAVNGGGISNYLGTATLDSSTFNSNSATTNGGGIANSSGALTVESSTFNDNSAATGGGIYQQGSTLTVTSSTFSGNSATTCGGIYVKNATAYLLNSIIINNTETNGDIYNDGSTVYAYYSWYNSVSGTINTQATAPNITTAYSEGDLGTLQDNGGLTYTMALSSSAPGYQQGCYVYYNEPDGFYFLDTNGYSRQLTDWDYCPDINPSDKITTDQRGVTITGTPSIGSYTVEAPAEIYYMAKVDGNWSSYGTVWFTSTTESTDPDDYTTQATEAPDADNSVGIIINDDIAVTITTDSGNFSIDQTTINSGASITVNDNVTLTVADDGTGATDLDADGSIIVDNDSSAGTLVIASGAAVDSNGTFTVNGVLSFDDSGDNDGTLTLAEASITIASLTAGSGTITYDGAVSQSVSALTYYNLTISGGGDNVKNLAAGTTTVSNNLTVAASTELAVGAQTLDLTGTSATADINGELSISTGTVDADGTFDATGGTIDFSDAGNLKLGGATITSLGSLDISKGTVWYDREGIQTVLADTYYDLNIYGSGTKTLSSGTVTVCGGLTVSAQEGNDVTFDISDSTTVQVAHTSTISETLEIAGSGDFEANGDFDATGGTVTFDNAGNLYIVDTVTSFGTLSGIEGTVVYSDTDSGQQILNGTYNCNLKLTGASKTLAEALTVGGDLNVNLTGSTTSFDTGSYTVEVTGSTTVTSGKLTVTSGSFTTTGMTDIHGTLQVNTGSYTADGDTDFTDSSGILRIVSGNYISNSGFDATGGEIDFVQEGNLKLNGATVDSLGTLDTSHGNVWYSREGAQTVLAGNYYSLKIAGSGTKTLASGTVRAFGNLTVSAGTLDVDDNTLNVANTSDIDGTLTIGTGTVETEGDFDASGGNITFTGAGNLKLGGSTITSLGTLSTDNGTVTYDRAGNQTVFANTYYNLKTSSSGTKSLGGTVNVTNDLTVSGEILSVGSETLNVSGSTTIASGKTLSISTGTVDADGTFDATGGTIDFTDAGNLKLGGATITSLGTLDTEQGNVWYNRAGSQTVLTDTYYDLIISGGSSSTKTLENALTVNGNLTIESSTILDISENNYGITLSGDWFNSGTFTERNGTVTLTGSSQTLGMETFYNLTSSGTGAQTLGGNVTVSNTLTTGIGTTFALGTYTLSLNGNWSNAATFNENTGTVNYTGSGQTVISETYYNLIISGGSDSTKTLGGAIDINGDITIDTSTILDTDSSNNYAINVAGNWTNNGTFNANSGTVTFDASGTSIISGETTFYNFTCTTADKTLTFATGEGNLQTIGGTFTLTGSDGNNIVVNSDSAGTQAEISVTAFSVSYVTVQDSNNSSGTDIEASNSTDSGNNTGWYFIPTGYYYRTNAIGTWNWSTITNWQISDDGVSNWTTATESPDYDNSIGITVRNGTDLDTSTTIVLIAADLTIDQTTIDNATLTVNTGITLTINDGEGTDLTDAGIFVNSGILANNGSVSITGTYSHAGTITGNSLSYSGVSSTLIYSGASQQTTTAYEFAASNGPANLTISNTEGVILNSNKEISGDLALDQNCELDGAYSLTVGGNAAVNGNIGSNASLSALSITGTSSIGSNITTTGIQAYSNTITLTEDTVFTGSIVTFSNSIDGTESGEQSLTVTGNTVFSGNIGNATELASIINNGNISISGNTAVNLTGDWDVNGNVTINSENTFTTTSNVMTVSGNWTNEGTFVHNNGTVILDGTGTSSISGENTFYNFYCITAGKTLDFNSSDLQTFNGLFKARGTLNSNLTINNLLSDITSYKAAYLDINNSNNDAGVNIQASFSTVDSYSTNHNWESVEGYIWYGSVNSSWNTAGNWNLEEVPDLEAEVQIDTVVNNLVLTQNTTVNSFTVSDSNTVIFGTNGITLTATSNFTNEGTIQSESGIGISIASSSVSGSIVSGTVNSGSTLTLAAYDINLNGIISAASNISITGTVDLTDDTSLTGNNINFSSTINGANSLLISGNASFNGIVGGTTALSGINVSGTTDIGVNISTSGTQNYTGASILNSNVVLTGTTISFESTLDSESGETNSLTVAGNAIFYGAIGATDNLSSLSVSGTSSIGSNITTTGSQSYSGAVTLIGNSILNSGSSADSDITLPAVTGSNYDFTINAPSDPEASTLIDSVSGVNTFTATGTGNTTVTNDLSAATISITDTSGTVTVGGTLSATTLSIDTGNSLDSVNLEITTGLTNNGTIYASGAVSIPSTATGEGSFIYDGSSQNVASSTYYNLSLTGSGSTKTLAGVVSVNADLLIDTGTTLDVSENNYDLNISGNWNKSGDFTERTGTVTFNGSTAQSLSGNNTFYNLTISNTSLTEAVTATGSLTVTNCITITSGTFISASIYENVVVEAGATLELDGDVTVSGDWTNNGTFTSGTNTVEFNGNNQTITDAGDGGFYNLTYSGIGEIILAGNVTVENSLTTAPGTTLNLGTATLSLEGNASIGGSVDASDAAIDYSGVNQTVLGITYKNLALTGTGIKTFASEVTVTEIFSVDSGITLAGEPLTYGASATLRYTGNAEMNTTAFEFPSSNDPFNIEIANSAGVNLHESRSISGSLTIEENGILNLTVNSLTVTGTTTMESGSSLNITESNWSSGTLTANGGTINYCGAAQNILDFNYYNLQLSGSGIKTLLADTTTLQNNLITETEITLDSNNKNLNIAGDWINTGSFTAGSGTVNYNGNAQNIAGVSYTNLTISGSGTKTAASPLNVTTVLSVSNGTILDVDDTLSVTGTLTNNGTIKAASTVSIPNAAIGGTFIYDGANQTIAQTQSYNNLTISGTGTKTISANETITVTGEFILAANMNLQAGTDGITTLNLNGNVTDTSGSFTGGDSSLVSYNGTNQTVIDGTYYNISFSGNGTKTFGGDITVNNDLTLNDSDVTLAIGSYSLIVSGDMNISSGNLTIGNGGIIKLGGTENNLGTFTAGTGSSVEYNGTDTQTVLSETYCNLVLDNGNTNAKILSGAITVNGNLTINDDAKLDVSSNNHSIEIKGNFINSGIFLAQAGTVTLNGTSLQQINGNGDNSAFHNLDLNNLSGALLTGNTTIDNQLALSTGLLTIGAYTLTLNANATVTGTPSSSNMLVTNSTGTVRKKFSETGSFVLPIGSNSSTPQYSPVTLNFTSGTFSSGGYVDVRVINTKDPNNSSTTNYLNRYWIVESSGISGFKANVTCKYLSGDITGTESSIYFGEYVNGSWTKYSVADASTHTISGTGLTSFCSITGISNSPNPNPNPNPSPNVNNGMMINDGTQYQTLTSWRTSIDNGPEDSIDNTDAFDPNEVESIGLMMDSLITFSVSAEPEANGEYSLGSGTINSYMSFDGEYGINGNNSDIMVNGEYGAGVNSSDSNHEFSSEYEGIIDLSFDLEGTENLINFENIALYHEKHPLFKTELDLLLEKI